MPYDDLDPDDPMALSGVALGAPAEAALEAGYAYVEELMRSGISMEAIVLTFQNPEYRGPYGVYLALGFERILDMVRECAAAFQACRDARNKCRAERT
jgi:hypothetical protein